MGRVGASADRRRVRRLVAAHFLTRVRHSHDGSGPALDDRDAANVRSAVTWAMPYAPELFDGAVAVAIGRFYETTGRLFEGQELLCRLATTGLAPAWVGAGLLPAMRGDRAAAVALSTRALRTAGEHDHTRGYRH